MSNSHKDLESKPIKSRADFRNEKRLEKKIKRKNEGKFKRFMRFTFSFILYLTLFIITIGSVGLLGATLIVNKELENLPPVDAQYLATYPVSEITDKNGNVIWKPTEYRVGVMEYEEIPELYRDFIISVEDKEFWESSGISPKGIFNMVVGTARSKVDSGYKARGGSTIDQQLIKNKYFDRGSGHSVVTRKIQEIFLSLQLNSNFEKEEIFTFYVNDLEFAENAKGTKAIMKTYFNKSPEDYAERTIENIAQQAYLAGLSQAPSAYNLYSNPKDGHKRMKTVLGILLEDELITEKEYNEAIKFDLTEGLQPRGWESKEQYAKNLKYKTYTDGVKKELREIGYNIDDLSIKVQSHLDQELYNKIESVARQDKYFLDKNQQIAVTVLDKDNIVVGMVGSRYGGDDELNRATQTSRSTGSSTKHILAYAPLLQYFGNQYNTASMFDTSNYRYPGSKAVMKNYGGYTHGNQTMKASLANSFNTPVARIMDGILGSNRVKTFLSGVDLDIQEKYTSVDGLGIHASTLQVASAFNAFNNLGQYSPPRFIDKIIFVNGEEKVIEPRTRKAMNASVAWVINDMLRAVPTEKGTARDAKINGFEGYAGKTGTVGFDKSVRPPAPYGIGASDLWYNSITNGGYSISIWVGYDKPNQSPQMPSRYKQHQILGRDLQKMLNPTPPKMWKMPKGVQHLSGSGLDAFYKVTDSSNNSFTLSSWPELEAFKSLKIEDVEKNSEVDENWEEKETSHWFEYYKEGGDQNPTVIDESLYQKMKGSE